VGKSRARNPTQNPTPLVFSAFFCFFLVFFWLLVLCYTHKNTRRTPEETAAISLTAVRQT
jgi:hypothetical protein